MSRLVDRHYLVSLLNQCYLDQQNNCNLCFERSCKFCEKTQRVKYQLSLKNYNGVNANVELWLILYMINYTSIITIKPVL